MDIDLLISQDNRAGIFATSAFESRVAGAQFDHESHELTLEFADMSEPLDCNVPVSDDLIPYLNQGNTIIFVVADQGQIIEARMVPLVHLNDNSNDMTGWDQ